jgi:hypothetical protein
MTTQLVKFKDFENYSKEIQQFQHYFEKHFKAYMEAKTKSWEINFDMLDGFVEEIYKPVKITETKYWDKPWQYNAPAHVYQLEYVCILVYVNHNNLLEIGDYFEIIINK